MQENKGTVLVVEDDDGIRTLLATILRLAGYEAISYADGDEALDQLRENAVPIHLLVTDVHLGLQMDGLELAQGLRAFYPSMRVLYISGVEDRVDMTAEVESGRASFLAKPFKPSALTEKVKDILNGTGTLSALPVGRTHP